MKNVVQLGAASLLALTTASIAHADELTADHLLETHFSGTVLEPLTDDIYIADTQVGDWTLAAIVSEADHSIVVAAIGPDETSLNWSVAEINGFLRESIMVSTDGMAALAGDCLGSEGLRDVDAIDDMLANLGPCGGFTSGGGGGGGGFSGGSGGAPSESLLDDFASLLLPDCGEINPVADGESDSGTSSLVDALIEEMEERRRRLMPQPDAEPLETDEERAEREVEESLTPENNGGPAEGESRPLPGPDDDDPNRATIPPEPDPPEGFPERETPRNYPDIIPENVQETADAIDGSLSPDEVYIEIKIKLPDGNRDGSRAERIRNAISVPDRGPMISPKDRTGLGDGGGSGVLGPLCGPATDAEAVRSCIGQGPDCYARVLGAGAALPGGCLVVPGEADQAMIWCFGSEGGIPLPEVDLHGENDNIVNDRTPNVDGPTPLSIVLDILRERGIDPTIAH
ncbi:MAG: hypothetical protein AAGA48_09025 [Myxococcota bacterium]